MAAGNTLVGEGPLIAQDFTMDAQPFPVGNNGATPMSAADANQVGNYVAFLVLIALAALILIRIGGLQGMIAVGRPT